MRCNSEHLEKFKSEAKQIIASFVEKLKEPPPIIYHYTSDVGLKGILDTGEVWPTDIFNLNDPSELRHGLSQAIDILKGKLANSPLQSKKFVGDLVTLF